VTRVGRVSALYRYPVKSMAGERFEAAEVTSTGVLGDRAYALIDEETGRVVSGKRPLWWARVMDCRATFTDPPHDEGPTPPVSVVMPDGSVHDSSKPGDVDRAATTLFGRDVRLESAVPEGASFQYQWPDMEGLVYEGRTFRDELTEHEMPPGTFFDSSTLLVLTTASMRRMGELAPGSDFDVRRFRPNIVIESDDEGFVEEDWLGGVLQIGDAVRLAITRPCLRCVMVTLAQADLPRDPGVLRAAFDHNDGNLGVKAAVLRPGPVRAGDAVEFLRRPARE